MESRHPLVLVVHVDEWKKPTNTGRWATLALKNSSVYVRGEKREAAREGAAAGGTRYVGEVSITAEPTLLLFPSDDSVPLRPADGPITLVVPDGNWRQASKIPKREPALKDLKRVHLPMLPPSALRLRKEHTAHGMATLEAIAMAYQILDPPVGAALLKLYELAAARVLAGSRSDVRKRLGERKRE